MTMAGSSLQFKDPWQEQRLFQSRVIAAAIIVLLLSGLLVTRLVQLQILDYERFAELSEGNSFRIDPVPPTRGLIFDRNGTVIAENRPNWELVATAEQIDNLDRTLRSLEVLGLVDPAEHDELRNLVRSHRGFERVKLSNLTEEQAATFAVRRHLFSGVDIQVALSRYYPFGEQTAHAIGYVHRDLRPRNIYLAVRRGKANFVKLLDFGLAKLGMPSQSAILSGGGSHVEQATMAALTASTALLPALSSA